MSLKAQTLRLLPAYFVAELVGTFLLVLIGDGAIASYMFTNRQVDPFSVCLAFGVGAMIASYVSIKLSGAHLNPAVSLALALDKRLKWELVPVYMVAQYAGGFLAALVLFLNYSEAINSIDGGDHTAINTNTSTGGVFATYPAAFVTVWGSLIDQVIGTGVLLFCLSALSDKRNLALEDRFQPPIVALAIGLVCFAFNVNCGAIFNPARDLSPRLLTALLGYRGVWEPVQGTYWYLAGIIGPHIGAIIGVFAYKYLIGTALEASQRHLEAVRARQAQENSGPEIMDSKPTRFAFQNPHHVKNHQASNCDTHQRNNHNHKQNQYGTPNTVQRRSDVPDYGSSVKQ